MKRFFSSRKRIVTVGIAAAAIIAMSVAAFAYWTQSGTGSGGATAGTTTGITVNQTSTITGLYPGGPAATLSGDFTNLNALPVTINSVTAVVDTFSSQTDLSKPACTEADFAIGGAAAGSIVPVGTGVGAWTGLTVALVNGAGNQDNCKSQAITITYTANPV